MIHSSLFPVFILTYCAVNFRITQHRHPIHSFVFLDVLDLYMTPVWQRVWDRHQHKQHPILALHYILSQRKLIPHYLVTQILYCATCKELPQKYVRFFVRICLAKIQAFTHILAIQCIGFSCSISSQKISKVTHRKRNKNIWMLDGISESSNLLNGKLRRMHSLYVLQ